MILPKFLLDNVIEYDHKYCEYPQHCDEITIKYYSKYQMNSNNSSLKEQWDWLTIAKNDLTDDQDGSHFLSLSKRTIPKPYKLPFTYYKAKRQLSERDTTGVDKLFNKVDANPFYTLGVIGKAEYLSDKDEHMEAYNVLLNALEINPYAVNLLKQYIMQCAVMDFDRFGDHALEKLQPLVSSQEYYGFRNKYEEKLKSTQEELEYFDDL